MDEGFRKARLGPKAWSLPETIIASSLAAYLCFFADIVFGKAILMAVGLGADVLGYSGLSVIYTFGLYCFLWNRMPRGSGWNIMMATERLRAGVSQRLSATLRGKPRGDADGLRLAVLEAIPFAAHAGGGWLLPKASKTSLLAIGLLLPFISLLLLCHELLVPVGVAAATRSGLSAVGRALAELSSRATTRIGAVATRMRYSVRTVFIGNHQYHELSREKREIRLLELDPPHPSGLIRGRMITKPLKAASEQGFEAVSYRWTTQYSRPIILDGRKLWVMSTVSDLLERLQPPAASRLLWIDSICINQNDKTEIAWQMGLMKDVYTGAKQVVGWLGRGTSARGALPFLTRLPDVAAAESERLMQNLLDAPLSPESNDDWKAVAQFLQNDWFSRVWIVQEVACAKRMVLLQGEEHIEWDRLADIAGRIAQGDDALRSCFFVGTTIALPGPFNLAIARGFTNILAFAAIRKRFKESGGLDQGFLLMAARKFDAQKDRDKVYGLRGLRPQEGLPPVDLDKPDRDVILEATREALLRGGRGDLTLLADAGCGRGVSKRGRQLGLPSWCPDLFAPASPRAMPIVEPFFAATHLECLVRSERTTDDRSDILTVRGTVVDSIEKLGEVFNMELFFSSGMAAQPWAIRDLVKGLIDQAYAMAEQTSHPSYTLTPKELVWRTTTGDTFLHQSGFDLDAILSLLSGAQQPGEPEAQGLGADWERREKDILYAVGATMAGNRLCLTSTGYLGVAPPEAEEGDKVAILWGASRPFILRTSTVPRIDPRATYELIGSCYVQGLMMGELRGQVLEPDMLLLL